MAIALGDKVRDRVTGYEGIVIARTDWLHGCARLTLQAQELKDGKPVDSWTIDELAAEVISPKKVTADTRPHRTGGPQNDAAALRR